MATTTRTPQEVFQHHAAVLVAGDMEGILSDYADDAVFITPAGSVRGRDGIRQGFEKVMGDLGNAKLDVPTVIFDGDILLIEWTAEGDGVHVADGIDTFVFEDGMIRAQTVRYTLQRD